MDENNKVEKFYDFIATEYSKECFDELNKKPFDRSILQRFSELTKGSGKVCDVGCGPGEIARFLKDLGIDVFGIDLSKEMICEAGRLSPDIIFEQGNMFKLKIVSKSLVGITAFYSIVNLTLDEVKLAIREFKRVLKHDGYLLLSFHIGNNETINVERCISEIKANVDFTYFNPDEIILLIEEAGFNIMEAIIRYPYKNAEYQSKRAYILAKNS